MSYAKLTAEYHREAALFGVGYADAEILRRAATTLHRWAEGECGMGNERVSWCYVRDEETGKTYREVHPARGASYRVRTPDRETAAMKRVCAIALKIGANVEHQGDPRGWPLRLTLADGRVLSPPPRGSA